MRYILLLTFLTCSLGFYGQEDLHIKNVFDHYARHHGSTMVQLSNDVLKIYDITLYKSLSFKPEISGKFNLDWVTYCIDEDKRKAKKIKETLFDGKLKSGYYQLPQVKKDINRFILFKQNDKGRTTLIYIEGSLGSAELVNMIFSRK